MIWKYTVIYPDPIYIDTLPTALNTPPISQTCQGLRHEILPLYYTHNVFRSICLRYSAATFKSWVALLTTGPYSFANTCGTCTIRVQLTPRAAPMWDNFGAALEEIHTKFQRQDVLFVPEFYTFPDTEPAAQMFQHCLAIASALRSRDWYDVIDVLRLEPVFPPTCTRRWVFGIRDAWLPYKAGHEFHGLLMGEGVVEETQGVIERMYQMVKWKRIFWDTPLRRLISQEWDDPTRGLFP